MPACRSRCRQGWRGWRSCWPTSAKLWPNCRPVRRFRRWSRKSCRSRSRLRSIRLWLPQNPPVPPRCFSSPRRTGQPRCAFPPPCKFPWVRSSKSPWPPPDLNRNGVWPLSTASRSRRHRSPSPPRHRRRSRLPRRPLLLSLLPRGRLRRPAYRPPWSNPPTPPCRAAPLYWSASPIWFLRRSRKRSWNHRPLPSRKNHHRHRHQRPRRHRLKLRVRRHRRLRFLP